MAKPKSIPYSEIKIGQGFKFDPSYSQVYLKMDNGYVMISEDGRGTQHYFSIPYRDFKVYPYKIETIAILDSKNNRSFI